MKSFGRMGVDALQDIFKICPGMNLVLAAGRAKGHKNCGCVPAGLTADK